MLLSTQQYLQSPTTKRVAIATVATSLGAVVSCAALFTLHLWYSLRRVRHIPRAPIEPGIANFFLGHFKTIKAKSSLQLCEYQNQVGKTYVYRYLSSVRVLVSSLADVRFILSQPALFNKDMPPYRALTTVLGEKSLVCVHHEPTHAILRRALSPAFSPRELERLADSVFALEASNLHAALAAQPPGAHLALTDFVADASLDIIARSTFGAPAGPVGKAFRDVLEASRLSPSRVIAFMGPAWLRRYLLSSVRRLMKAVEAIADGIVDRAAAIPPASVTPTSTPRSVPRSATPPVTAAAAAAAVGEEEGEDVGSDMLLRILGDKLASHEWSASEVRDHVVTFLFAGHETITTAMTWTSYFLAANPAVQDRAAAAARAPAGTPGRAYLKWVILESLRVRPPVAVVGRRAARDAVLPSGVVIPAGCDVVVSPMVGHLDAAVWGADAATFDPTRWDPAAGRVPADPFAFMPFVHGKRNCIGKDFAVMEMEVLLARILASFTMALAPGFPEPRGVLAVTQTMVPALRVTLARRP